MKNIYETYSKMLVEHSQKVLILGLLMLIAAGIGITNIETASISYGDMTPDDTETSENQEFLEQEFGTGGNQITFVIEGSEEIEDVRDPESIKYIDRLTQMVQQNSRVIEADSITNHVDPSPSSITDSKQNLESASETSFELNSTDEYLLELENDLEKVQNASAQTGEGLGNITGSLQDTHENLRTLNNRLDETKHQLDPVEEPDLSNPIDQASELEEQNRQLSENLDDLPEDPLDDFEDISTEEIQALLDQNAEFLSQIQEQLEEIESEMQGLAAQQEELEDGLQDLHQSYTQVEDGVSGILHQTREVAEHQIQSTEGIADARRGILQHLEYRNQFKDEPEEVENHELIENRYFDDDYRITIVRARLADIPDNDKPDYSDDMRNLIESTDPPQGLDVGVTGEPMVYTDIEGEVRPTVQRTGTLALLVVGSSIMLFFMSWKYGVSAFLTVLIAEIFVLGYMGWSDTPMSTEMAALVPIILAFGDGFGIQLVNRFKQELRSADPQQALEESLSSVMRPMLLATTGIVIGFQAFRLGELHILETLANMLTLGIIACFITAVTIIPAFLITVEQRFGN